MLNQRTNTLTFSTEGRQFHDITREVAAEVKAAGIAEGLDAYSG